MAAKEHTNEKWFKAKRYGWGWGLPNNRKGWLSYGLFFAVWLGSLIWFTTAYSGLNEPSDTVMAIFFSVIVLDVLALAYVSFKYGEAPKWRWGKKRGSAEP